MNKFVQLISYYSLCCARTLCTISIIIITFRRYQNEKLKKNETAKKSLETRSENTA